MVDEGYCIGLQFFFTVVKEAQLKQNYLTAGLFVSFSPLFGLVCLNTLLYLKKYKNKICDRYYLSFRIRVSLVSFSHLMPCLVLQIFNFYRCKENPYGMSTCLSFFFSK